MKKRITLIILALPILIYGQDSSSGEQSTSNQSRISVGVNSSPNYSYRILKYEDASQNTVDLRADIEHPSMGFNTGLVLQYLITEELEFEAGLQFARQTQLFKNLTLTDEMGNDLGFADNESRFYYLELPLRLNYRFINKKVFGYISGGASVNQFLMDGSKSWLSYSNGDTEVVKGKSGILDFNKTTFSVLAAIGVGYHMNDRLNLRLEPIYRYSLTPLSEAPIKQHNYSIGCQVGMYLKL